MAWRPKTIAGKILKGAVVAGGSVLGLATGAGLITKAVGGAAKIATVAKGTGALAKVGGFIEGVNDRAAMLKNSAANLISGVTQEQRALINKAKESAKTEAQKLLTVERLVSTGMDVSAARAAAGISSSELVEYEGEPIKEAGIASFLNSKNAIYIVGGLAALFILPKLFKK